MSRNRARRYYAGAACGVRRVIFANLLYRLGDQLQHAGSYAWSASAVAKMRVSTVMSSSWPNRGGGVGDLLRRLPADLLRPVEAEELPGGAAGFHNSVGEKGERVPRVERDSGLWVGGLRHDAQWEAGFAGQLTAIVVGTTDVPRWRCSAPHLAPAGRKGT